MGWWWVGCAMPGGLTAVSQTWRSCVAAAASAAALPSVQRAAAAQAAGCTTTDSPVLWEKCCTWCSAALPHALRHCTLVPCRLSGPPRRLRHTPCRRQGETGTPWRRCSRLRPCCHSQHCSPGRPVVAGCYPRPLPHGPNRGLLGHRCPGTCQTRTSGAPAREVACGWVLTTRCVGPLMLIIPRDDIGFGHIRPQPNVHCHRR